MDRVKDIIEREIERLGKAKNACINECYDLTSKSLDLALKGDDSGSNDARNQFYTNKGRFDAMNEFSMFLKNLNTAINGLG